MGKVLEICCDASMKTYNRKSHNERSFGCAGAIALGYDKTLLRVLPDCTNNRAEIYAILLAVKLAHEIMLTYGDIEDIYIYSDSKFCIYGINVWMDSWLKRQDENGVMYNYEGTPVKNQDIFVEVIDYLIHNNLKVHFRHQKGHTKVTNERHMNKAADCFFDSNGYYVDRETLSRISHYNNIIDEKTRYYLEGINPKDYPKMNLDLSKRMCRYIIPITYKDYIA